MPELASMSSSDSSHSPSALESLKVTIAAGTYEGVLAGWELYGRSRRLKLLFASPIHGGSVRGLALMATQPSSQQHSILVSCGYDESLQLHDFTKRTTSSGQLRTPADFGTPTCLQLAPPPASYCRQRQTEDPQQASTHCLVGFVSGTLALYHKKDWSVVHVMPKAHAGNGGVSSLAVHPSGKLALSGGREDGKLQVWDLLTGKLAYTHKVQNAVASVSNGKKYYEPIESIVWSPQVLSEDDSVTLPAGSAYAYCYGKHVTVCDVATGRPLLDVELPSRVNQICFLPAMPGTSHSGLCVAAAGNDGSLAVLKVGSVSDTTVERRAVMAIEPVDRTVAGEERFKCLQHVTGYVVATANSAGVVSLMDLTGAVNMIHDQRNEESDDENDQAEETPEGDEDDDDSVELAVDLIDGAQLGTGARITCLAAWAEEADAEEMEKDQQETVTGESSGEKQKDGEDRGPTRKRPVGGTKEVVIAKDDLDKARELVAKAKKIQERKEKKRQKKRHNK